MDFSSIIMAIITYFTEVDMSETQAAESVETTKSVPGTLRVKRLSEDATLPFRASKLAAGYDLSSAEDTSIAARGKALIKTDLSLTVPSGTYGRIAPRSSLAWKNHIDVGAGVIDEGQFLWNMFSHQQDYTGPVGVVLFNHADTAFEVKKGAKIAQLIIEKIMTPEVEEVGDLNPTERGVGGFGSTDGSQNNK